MMKIKHIHIDRYKIFNDFDIDFCENSIPLDLVVITGVNGCGKTTLLKDIIYGSLSSAGEDSSITIDKDGIQHTIKLPHRLYKIIDYSQLHYFSASETKLDLLESVIIKYVDKMVYENGKTSYDAYAEIQKLLDDIFTGFNLQIRFHGIDRDKKLIFINTDNQQFGIENLSGGEKQILAKVFTLFTDEMKNSTVLMDEPEESLHPSWQSCLVPVLRRCSKENNIQFILATHSSQIIASARKEEIRLLTRDENNKMNVFSCEQGAYGWTVDRVLREIQKAQYIRVPEVEDKLELLNNMIETNQYESSIFKTIFYEMETLLGYSDQDLVLMRMEIMRKKKKHEKNNKA